MPRGSLFARARASIRVGATLTILAAAGIAGVAIWNIYMVAPWTRDGQVQVYVVNLAPEVSGRVIHLGVVDNQPVKRGDLLYEIDPVDTQIALAQAQANAQSRLADLKTKQAQSKRRETLTTLSVSQEEQQTYASAEEVAAAAYATAMAQLSQARTNVERTKVTSPVNGFVTNLLLREGDYATTGARNITLVDSDSFWVVGYFEETKLGGIRKGDPAVVALIAYRAPLRGHVESIARGINTPNTDPGALGLASVSPVFTWVRLAQRIPVRIHIDEVPPEVHLAAGMTATVSIGKAAAR